MFNRNSFIFLLIVALLMVFYAGCDDSSTSPKEEKPPTIESTTIEIPTKMQTAANNGDPGAAIAVSYITMANSFSGFTNILTPPENAQRSKPVGALDDTWTYTWSSQNLSLEMTVTETDEYVHWVMIYDGTDGVYTYNNFKFLEAMQYKAFDEGWMKVFDPMTTGLLWEYMWETDSNGTFHFDMYVYSEGNVEATVNVEVNSDGSGEVVIDLGSSGSYVVQWAADGTGSWTYYNSDGSVAQSGSWS